MTVQRRHESHRWRSCNSVSGGWGHRCWRVSPSSAEWNWKMRDGPSWIWYNTRGHPYSAQQGPFPSHCSLISCYHSAVNWLGLGCFFCLSMLKLKTLKGTFLMTWLCCGYHKFFRLLWLILTWIPWAKKRISQSIIDVLTSVKLSVCNVWMGKIHTQNTRFT